jgi:hypothetical protein
MNPPSRCGFGCNAHSHHLMQTFNINPRTLKLRFNTSQRSLMTFYCPCIYQTWQLRVDGAVMRLRDTRLHCSFGSKEGAKPVVLRELCWREATFAAMSAVCSLSTCRPTTFRWIISCQACLDILFFHLIFVQCRKDILPTLQHMQTQILLLANFRWWCRRPRSWKYQVNLLAHLHLAVHPGPFDGGLILLACVVDVLYVNFAFPRIKILVTSHGKPL